VTGEEPQVSADQAVQRSWLKLRRAHKHKADNKDAQRWDAIGESDHLAEAVAATWIRGREAT